MEKMTTGRGIQERTGTGGRSENNEVSRGSAK